jgi:hypothetical protein
MLRHHRQQVPVSPPPFRARPQNAPKSGFGEIVNSPQKVRKSLLVAVRRNVPFPAPPDYGVEMLHPGHPRLAWTLPFAAAAV